VPEPTIAQRIVRAKRQLAGARALRVAARRERERRIGAVLAVLYLVFNEGYRASAGEDWLRPQLAQEAMRLGRSCSRWRRSTPRRTACRR
jgi:predicted RNA polymerase sigma factor